MTTTGISADGTYWISYLAKTLPNFKTVFNQVVLYPPGGAPVGANATFGIAPARWLQYDGGAGTRCPGVPRCYAAGDYVRMAAGPASTAALPTIQQARLPFGAVPQHNELMQGFVQNVQGAVYSPYDAEPIGDPVTESSTDLDADGSELPPLQTTRSFRPNNVFYPYGANHSDKARPVPPQAFGGHPRSRTKRGTTSNARP